MFSLKKEKANALVHYGHRFCPIPNGFDGSDSPFLQREKENPVEAEPMEWDDVPQGLKEHLITVFEKSDGQSLGQYPFILDTATRYDIFSRCRQSSTEKNKLNSPFIEEDENSTMMDCDYQMNFKTTDAIQTGSRSPSSAFPVFFMSNGLFIPSSGHFLEMDPRGYWRSWTGTWGINEQSREHWQVMIPQQEGPWRNPFPGRVRRTQ